MTAHTLPEGWCIKAIGDPTVAIINPPEKLPKLDTYPFIPMDAVEDKFGGVKYIETIKEASGGYTRFRDGDILFAKITPCVENGKVARINGLNGALGLGSTEFHAIRPAENTDGDYLYYLMSSGVVHGPAVSLMEGTTGRQRIPASIFKRRLAVPMPLDKREQRRIAAVLSKVDETTAKIQTSIAAAQKLKCGLMLNLLTGKLRPDGTWRQDDEFDIDPKFGRTPKGWAWLQMRTFGEIVTGRTPPPADESNYAETGYSFITPGDLGESRMIAITERYVTEAGLAFSSSIPEGAVCVVCIGSTIGKVGISQKVCCTNQQINALIPNDDSDANFIFFLLNSQQQRLRLWAGVNATPQLNKSDFGKYRVLAPKTKDEQSAIASPMLAIDNEITQKQVKIERLKKLKKSLMQNLLTGKVRIPPDLKIE